MDEDRTVIPFRRRSLFIERPVPRIDPADARRGIEAIRAIRRTHPALWQPDTHDQADPVPTPVPSAH